MDFQEIKGRRLEGEQQTEVSSERYLTFDLCVVIGDRQERVERWEHERYNPNLASALVQMTHAGRRFKSKVYSQSEK
ncbi:hypothetical protein E2C01_062160 [Portunus trituberculatus]|uniref:Uncharacterized protein n=1 Tax=Portunus trituberculatus TaxID=210409 RepID=A0A5B7H5Q4_PORTR|nr:hypothetical protein [Portunus trituberculatus]